MQFTAYSANDWSNSTGEGDNDYQTFPLRSVRRATRNRFHQAVEARLDTILVNGQKRSCYHTIAVLVDSPSGYACMNAHQYAVNFYGPFGGSVDRWRTLGKQDYDARVTQQLGAGVITLEGFADAYNNNLPKGPGQVLDVTTQYGPGPN